MTGLCAALVLATAAGAAAQGARSAAKSTTLTAMDRIEIQQLVARYGYALDTGADNGYAYADLFAPDGVFVGMNQGEKGRSYRGRETLAALARGGQRGPNFVSHFITNMLIEPSPEGAVGRQYAVVMDIGENNKPSSISHGGHYDDVYVKTAAGWRFKSRVFYASESGPDPKQLRSRPLDAPAAASSASSAPAGAPAPRSASAPAGKLTVDDYQQIQQLVSSYPYALDTGANNGYMYADLFAPDGEFIRPYTKGRDNLATLALDQPHGPAYVRHFLANQLIEPTADGAIGKQYLVVIDIGEGQKPSSIFLGGHYEDVYVKTPQGWRFKRREFIPSRAGVQPPEAQSTNR
jgi:hypothetical protein